MTGAISPSAALARLVPEPGLVVLMCGVAGSGKTTFSQQLELRGFIRLSLDELIWKTAGRYGLDYPSETYDEKVAVAREALKAALADLLIARHAVVVDSAFWKRSHRQDFAQLVAAGGGRARIVYLKASRELLRARLVRRSRRFDANAALPIDDARLDAFVQSFEEPSSDEAALLVLA